MKSVIANENINAKQVLLIDADGKSTIEFSVALERAYAQDLDLVQVADGAIPVVKITDLNKFEYEKKQADKAAKKKQRLGANSIKEIQFTAGTQEHDLAVKLKSTMKFLGEGKTVRIVMRAAGRLSSHAVIEHNVKTLSAFVSRLGDTDIVQAIQMQGKLCTCTVKPKQG